MSAPRISLYEPTDLILAVANIKCLDYSIESHRDILPDIPGPALTFGAEIAIGEHHVLGWMDRRHKFPPLYPHNPEEYGRVATVSYAVWNEHVEPLRIFTERDPDKLFLFFNYPSLADVQLALKLQHRTHPAVQRYVRNVFNFTGAEREELRG